MDVNLLKPNEVDMLFRYPAGRTLRLAKAGKIPFVKLPDGELRFNETIILEILNSRSKRSILGGRDER